jgi:hypothetical protein
VTTVAVAVHTTSDAKTMLPLSRAGDANVMVDQVDQSADLATGPPAPALPATLHARLRGIEGVTGLVEVNAATRLTVRVFGSTGPAGLVACAQLASVPVLGRCPADVTMQRLNASGLDVIAAGTNGSQRAIERERTILDNAYPVLQGPQTIGELDLIAPSSTLTNAYQQLVDVVIVTSLAIAGRTLATSIAVGLADRKRPFSMLRLTGARLATLRRVVVLESAVPLIAVAIVAIGVGFGASAIFTSAEMQHSLVAPGAGYYLITAAGIVASLVIIAAAFPLLRLITDPEAARNE